MGQVINQQIEFSFSTPADTEEAERGQAAHSRPKALIPKAPSQASKTSQASKNCAAIQSLESSERSFTEIHTVERVHIREVYVEDAQRPEATNEFDTLLSDALLGDAELKVLWDDIAARFFPEHFAILREYTTRWSRRAQKRTLASCNLCDLRITVAREMRMDDYKDLLEPLLYHEMCHAVIGKQVPRRGGKRSWHGPEFRTLERRHPGIAVLDQWIKSGGWSRAIRRDRARKQWQSKRSTKRRHAPPSRSRSAKELSAIQRGLSLLRSFLGERS